LIANRDSPANVGLASFLQWHTGLEIPLIRQYQCGFIAAELVHGALDLPKLARQSQPQRRLSKN
jgi:hypothetical protein